MIPFLNTVAAHIAWLDAVLEPKSHGTIDELKYCIEPSKLEVCSDRVKEWSHEIYSIPCLIKEVVVSDFVWFRMMLQCSILPKIMMLQVKMSVCSERCG